MTSIARRAFVLPVWVLGLMALSACTIEMGPPPESDPPLVTERERPPPPPAQPTEPQAWSKDLDFEGGELSIRRGGLAEGLVAAEESRTYSAERLTFESAASSERPPTEAELVRERARKRLEEAQARQPAGPAAQPVIAPPEVVAAPVESVSAEALPEQSPDVLQSSASDTGPETGQQPAGESSMVAEVAPLPAQQADVTADDHVVAQDKGASKGQAAGQTQLASTAPLVKLPQGEPPSEELADTLLESWDAPDGTILVQVSAIRDKLQIAGEWERLKSGYPEILGPLRLVVEEAKVGERGVFFRVQAGGFASQDQAEAACVVLTDQGQSCFVLERSIGG
ncbi:hypothetical protein HBA54_01190 [Pelagibius litoralis]|uniref:SPOR domain-containing protein n=1 Tax=Pelagibius litoralis TaxID=374515 RepID=A0A967C1I6_9PROT|nr:SPOR domain-containing protein [Pelagibius litoralis]NIA67201.1 hypothetical protein [Pelagibius litoralis]